MFENFEVNPIFLHTVPGFTFAKAGWIEIDVRESMHIATPTIITLGLFFTVLGYPLSKDI